MKQCLGCGEIKDIHIIPSEPRFCERCHGISLNTLSQNLPMTDTDLIAQVRLAVEDLRRRGEW